eukprot:TRINITY_DN3327_c0_g2_i1.p1 TRINITY_DN3327_c0_g2~~TRINITY_DN3327_c0_g2_i1.p1  ORF type:complete len:504 (+),score=107.34 TRINITY_DN3327_c0_g2_i1:105-1616(+)
MHNGGQGPNQHHGPSPHHHTTQSGLDRSSASSPAHLRRGSSHEITLNDDEDNLPASSGPFVGSPSTPALRASLGVDHPDAYPENVWTADLDISLFESIGHCPPIGVNIYLSALNSSLYIQQRHPVPWVTPEAVMYHLQDLYNLEPLAQDERDVDFSECDFSLVPPTDHPHYHPHHDEDFSELIQTRAAHPTVTPVAPGAKPTKPYGPAYEAPPPPSEPPYYHLYLPPSTIPYSPPVPISSSASSSKSKSKIKLESSESVKKNRPSASPVPSSPSPHGRSATTVPHHVKHEDDTTHPHHHHHHTASSSSSRDVHNNNRDPDNKNKKLKATTIVDTTSTTRGGQSHPRPTPTKSNHYQHHTSSSSSPDVDSDDDVMMPDHAPLSSSSGSSSASSSSSSSSSSSPSRGAIRGSLRPGERYQSFAEMMYDALTIMRSSADLHTLYDFAVHNADFIDDKFAARFEPGKHLYKSNVRSTLHNNQSLFVKKQNGSWDVVPGSTNPRFLKK